MASKNTLVKIEAKPEPNTIDLARTAIVVVDMQNDFGAEGGMFHRAGVDISSIRQAIVPTARVLAAARKSGAKIVYLKTEYRPDLSDLGPVDSPNWIALKRSRVGERVTTPDGTEGHIMIRETWNTQMVCELVPEPGDIVVSKHLWWLLRTSVRKMGELLLISAFSRSWGIHRWMTVDPQQQLEQVCPNCLRSKPSSVFEGFGIGDVHPIAGGKGEKLIEGRSEERRVGKECRSRWSPYH